MWVERRTMTTLQTTGWVRLAVLFAGSCCCVAVTGHELNAAEMADRKLIAAIKTALKQADGPESVVAAVGEKATLNTVWKPDRVAFLLAHIEPDPDRGPALPDRDSLRWLVYWVR